MNEVFQSTIAHTLKATLAGIVDDETDGLESKMYMKKWMDQPDMEDAYDDVLEMSGLGLASEKTPGAPMAVGQIREGYLTRFIARTFAQQLNVTEEAMDDTKYPEAIKAARRLKRSMYKTQDIDATNVLVRGFNTAYTGGDGLPLFSASHTLANGGTFSNLMATSMTPSRAAVIVARAAVDQLPGHDGIIEGYNLDKVICPVQQKSDWEMILGSTHAPEPGQFNAINVANKLDLTLVAIPYWSNTTSSFAFQTDAEGRPCFRHRRKPRSRTWVENSPHVMCYSIDARWARGWEDPRSMYGNS